MPLGLKPSCSVCKANSSAMWRKSSQGEIVCNNCAGKSPGAGCVSGLTAGPGSAPAAQQSNGGGGGGGKQAKQEIHRRSARLRNTKYRSMPPAEKKVSTKGKGRRHIFKLKNGIYYQIGDIVSVADEDDEKVYYAQIRGFVQDQYCEKSAVITWLIPTQASSKDHFDAATYILGPEEDLPRKMEHFEFICHAPSEYFKSRSTPFPVIPTKPEKGYIWTRVGPTPAITVKESIGNSL
ncbi:GATA zinc finger domain-containing protein 1 isoform X2 [Chiloscyllium plagiosum]|uniref:GATA zinc finger domain-containing protein 1 isoform X2 n=1 Tax=Chiloscyllium plagiosum TaxID=36176 RepID=UPI001CB8270F|nr:GATA zinc finger domain-containing protein 1 isoform X2 [Chiloscyllium plagiosum]